MIPPLLLRTCSECGGRGKRAISGLPGFSSCSRCSGSGMVKEMPKEHKCPHCGVRFAWDGAAWLVADRHGRQTRFGEGFAGDKPEPQIRDCPNCRRPLSIGAARVEEVVE